MPSVLATLLWVTWAASCRTNVWLLRLVLQQQEQYPQGYKWQCPLPDASPTITQASPRYAPPPQNSGDRQVLRLNPYNLTTSSKSNKSGAKDSQWGYFPSHFLSKTHHTGLKTISAPGVETRNVSRTVYPGGPTNPSHQKDTDKGIEVKEVRLFCYHCPAQQSLNNPSDVKRNKTT